MVLRWALGFTRTGQHRRRTGPAAGVVASPQAVLRLYGAGGNRVPAAQPHRPAVAGRRATRSDIWPHHSLCTEPGREADAVRIGHVPVRQPEHVYARPDDRRTRPRSL